MELTNKQLGFAKDVAFGKYEYFWQAYEAHYNTDKMSKNAIYVESCRLMQNPKITLRIKQIQEEFQKRNHATIDEVLTEMSKWLRFDIRDLFNRDSTLKNVDDLPEDIRKSIASFEVVELFSGTGEKRSKIGELKKVKLFDKTKVADMFMKKFGAYITKLKFEDDDLSHIQDLVNAIKK